MTLTSHDTSRPATRAGRPPTSWRLTLAAAVFAVGGAAIMLYPATASWFADLHQRDALQSYAQQIDALDPAEIAERRDAAVAYNAQLVGGTLRDPFTNTDAGPLDDDARAYLDEITATPGEIMTELRIPGVADLLPVYHGTSAETLERGIGHLYGSSLPVGGDGTHAVLTGHRGYPQATMFSNLDRLAEGDEFTLTTLGETMTYRVTSTSVVEPHDTASLAVVPGADLVTLITCTPIGINTHRILVHAERVDGDASSAAVDQSPPLAFPWWVAGWAVAIAAGAGIVVRRGTAGRERR